MLDPHPASKSFYSQALRHPFTRFLFTGLINSAFGFGCFAAFLYLGVHYALALALATILGILFNFKTIGRLVFRSNDNRLIYRFTATYAIVYAINITGIKLLNILGMNAYFSGAILLLPMALLAFGLNKRFVFDAKTS